MGELADREQENPWAAIRDALTGFAFVRDDKVRRDGRAAPEEDVARSVAEHLPKFFALNL